MSIKNIVLILIRTYQVCVSPFYGGGPVCKYLPSCSNYGHEAITSHGVIQGTWLTITRLVRCNPFSKGGFDPVP